MNYQRIAHLLALLLLFLFCEVSHGVDSPPLASEKIIAELKSENSKLAQRVNEMQRQLEDVTSAQAKQNTTINALDRFYVKNSDAYRDIREQILHSNSEMLSNVRHDNDKAISEIDSDNNWTIAWITVVVAIAGGALPLYLNSKNQEKNAEQLEKIKSETSTLKEYVDRALDNMSDRTNKLEDRFDQNFINTDKPELNPDEEIKITADSEILTTTSRILNESNSTNKDPIQAIGVQSNVPSSDSSREPVTEFSTELSTKHLNANDSSLKKKYIEELNSAIDLDDLESSINKLDELEVEVISNQKEKDLFKKEEYNQYQKILKYNRGVLNAKSGKYSEAITDYSKSIEFDPNDASIYASRAFAYSETQKYNLSKDDYDNAIKLGDDNAAIYANRGSVNFLLKRYEDALNDFNKAIELESNVAYHYWNRSNTYSQLEAYALALSDLEKAIYYDPKKSDFYNNKAILEIHLGMLNKAYESFKEALRLDSNNCSYYVNLSELSRMLGDYKGSLENINKAIGLEPEMPALYERRAMLNRLLASKDKTNPERSREEYLNLSKEDIAKRNRLLKAKQ